MGGENQSHHSQAIVQTGGQQHNFESSSSSVNNNNNYGYGNNQTNGMSNEAFVNNMMRQVDDPNIYQNRANNMQSQQTLPNLDLNSILGLGNNNSAVPSHLGHHGGHHLVTHLMGAQYNFNQPPQPAPAYTGPTHSVLPSLPIHVNNNNNNNNMNNQQQQRPQQQYSNNQQQQQQFMNQQQQPMMNMNGGGNNTHMNMNTPMNMNGNMNNNNNMNNNGMMNSPMMNMNGNGNNNQSHMTNGGNNGDDQDLDAYSQDVLLLVVEQQRRIYHLEEELQKANEYINKLQEYAKNLEIDKEKHAKKQSRYWTQQEHQKFLQGIEKFGRKNVKEISNFVGSRNPTQVRTHAQKYYAKIEREQRRALGSDGKRNSIGGNSNSSGNESDDDIIADENFVSDGSGSGSSGSGNGNGSNEYENFSFPKQQDQDSHAIHKHSGGMNSNQPMMNHNNNMNSNQQMNHNNMNSNQQMMNHNGMNQSMNHNNNMNSNQQMMNNNMNSNQQMNHNNMNSNQSSLSSSTNGTSDHTSSPAVVQPEIPSQAVQQVV